jgi:uncharacterized membrane protein YhaH (DUF805 family)
MEDIQKAVKTCLSKYADFSGRAARPEFWWFFLFQIIVMVITGAISDILYGIAALGLLLPGLAVGARRLHDIGKSAWLLLVGLIPILGFLLLLYWFAQPSEGPNAFGNPDVTPDSPTVMPGPGQQ